MLTRSRVPSLYEKNKQHQQQQKKITKQKKPNTQIQSVDNCFRTIVF